MEYLDIVDENGVPTGKIAERTAAHKQGTAAPYLPCLDPAGTGRKSRGTAAEKKSE